MCSTRVATLGLKRASWLVEQNKGADERGRDENPSCYNSASQITAGTLSCAACQSKLGAGLRAKGMRETRGELTG